MTTKPKVAPAAALSLGSKSASSGGVGKLKEKEKTVGEISSPVELMTFVSSTLSRPLSDAFAMHRAYESSLDVYPGRFPTRPARGQVQRDVEGCAVSFLVPFLPSFLPSPFSSRLLEKLIMIVSFLSLFLPLARFLESVIEVRPSFSPSSSHPSLPRSTRADLCSFISRLCLLSDNDVHAYRHSGIFH